MGHLAAPLGFHEVLAGEEIAPRPEADGLARLVEEWLRVFGPGTAADIKWWLGSTLGAVRGALAALHAVEVDLDGRTGFLLHDDLTEWFGGTRVLPMFPSPLSKAGDQPHEGSWSRT